MQHRRRDVLRGLAAGGLVSVASLAGCTQLPTGETEPEQRERPSYHRYVPAADDGEGTFFVALDFRRFRELEDRDLESELPEGANVDFEDGGGLEDADPMLAYPAAGLFVGVLGLSFGLVPYGFGSDVAGGFASGGFGSETPTPDGDGGERGDDGPAQVDTAVMLDGAFVFDGSFEPETIAEAAEGFERTDERDGFAVYEGTDDGESLISTEGLGFAVSEDALVALFGQDDGDEPRAKLDGVLDVVAGDAGRLSEDGDADWALRRAGHGLVTLGGWGVDPDETEQADGVEIDSVLEGATGLVTSLSVPDERARSDVAAVFPEGETPDSEQIEDELGASATDREVEVDGTRVSVTATWSVEEGTATDTP